MYFFNFAIENTQSVNIICTVRLCEREIYTRKLLKKPELEKYNSLRVLSVIK